MTALRRVFLIVALVVIAAALVAAFVFADADAAWHSPIAKRARACDQESAKRWTPAELRCVVRTIFPRDEWANAERVIECESSWNRTARHVNVDGSVDLGMWQINSRWNADGIRYALDPVEATAYALRTLRVRGWGDWVCADLVGIV
jgi:hypothetical protein